MAHVYVEAADVRARQAAREREQARGGACHDGNGTATSLQAEFTNDNRDDRDRIPFI